MNISIKKEALSFLKEMIIIIVIMIIALQFVRPTIVFGDSMEETLSNKDYLILSKQAYLLHDIERGDVIVFTPNNGEPGKNYIKRVIAIPGDKVSISDGEVYINDEVIIEPYLSCSTTPGEVGEITIPNNKCFVLGDNRDNSTDSRSPTVGLVSKNSILGKALFRAFPISDFGIIE